MAATIDNTQKAPLHTPPLEEVRNVLERGLNDNFEDVNVTVVDCPDLTEKPYMLAEKGLCGSQRIADVGGPAYLLPLANTEKIYNFETIAENVELPSAFIVGAGAAPQHQLGYNAEMIANIRNATKTSEIINKTRVCRINPQKDGYSLVKSDSTDFCLMGNFFISEGLSGKVLEIKASKRKGPLNFSKCLRLALEKSYGTKPVGMGGVFVVESGKVKMHVMPDYPTKPIYTEAELDNWLRFFEMKAPLVCLGCLVSTDPDLDLRLEHFHGYSEHGDGGHYHYDTTPSDASYHGFFSIAEFLYRIDRPKETHEFGKN